MEDSAIFRARLDLTPYALIAQAATAVRVPSVPDIRLARGNGLANSVGMNRLTRERGSSLVEALVAALIVSTGVVTMAQLLSIATVTNLAARRSTVAAIVAEQKLEELRTLPFEYLQTSPSSTLEQNTDGYVDYVGIYTRRWSIEPVSSIPGSSLVIQVLVTTENEASRGTRTAARIRGHARVVAIRTRRAK